MNYLREIGEIPGILEELGEIFDNAIDLLTPNAIVYGGAIRDVVAGMELKGDLDIAVAPQEAGALIGTFLNDAKWIEPQVCLGPGDIIRQGHRPDAGPRVSPSSSSSKKWGSPRLSSSNYEDLAPIEKVKTFKTIGGVRVQIVTSSASEKSPMENVLEVVKNVDIICCGLCMMFDGRVFEVVKGAENDCLKKILRMNYDSCNLVDLDRAKKRLEHLKSRGWKMSVNMKELERKIKKKAKEALRKKEEEMERLFGNRSGLIERLAQREHGSPYIHFSSKVSKTIGGRETIRKMLGNVDIANNIQVKNDGGLRIEVPSNQADEVAQYLDKEIRDHILSGKHSKREKLGQLYGSPPTWVPKKPTAKRKPSSSRRKKAMFDITTAEIKLASQSSSASKRSHDVRNLIEDLATQMDINVNTETRMSGDIRVHCPPDRATMFRDKISEVLNMVHNIKPNKEPLSSECRNVAIRSVLDLPEEVEEAHDWAADLDIPGHDEMQEVLGVEEPITSADHGGEMWAKWHDPSEEVAPSQAMASFVQAAEASEVTKPNPIKINLEGLGDRNVTDASVDLDGGDVWLSIKLDDGNDMKRKLNADEVVAISKGLFDTTEAGAITEISIDLEDSITVAKKKTKQAGGE